MKVDIIGVPLDLGANRRGVDMGPSAIRYAGLKDSIQKLNIEYRDLGNLNVAVSENSNENALDNKLKHLNEINKVNEELTATIIKSLQDGSLPIVLGGDHSIAVGAILGTQCVRKNIGVIWLDAHGDFNNKNTTESGNLHGMPLAALTGFGPDEMIRFKPDNTDFINPKKIVLVGIRSLDKEEILLLKRSGVSVFTMADIDAYGIKEIMKRALDIAADGTNGLHLSFDLDAIDPSDAPGVGTPVYGGMTFREAHLAVEMVSDYEKLCSMEFVEVNPILDHMNRTGELAVTLICSAVGKKIYN